MVELRKLEKRIKEKFGTKSCFCRCAGVNEYELQKLFALERNAPGKSEDRAKAIEQLGELCRSTDPKQDPNKIGQELRDKISEKVMEFGGVKKFVDKHHQFTVINIYQIIQGSRTMLTARVKELIKVLEIE